MRQRVGEDTAPGQGNGHVEAVLQAPTEWREPPSWLPPTFHALAYRNYALLLLGQLSNSLSMWMDLVARPALVVAMTGSAVQLGLIALVRGLPMTILGPFAGVLADRVDRRILMLVSKVSSLVITTGFSVLILTGNVELWHVYVTAILRSLAMAFDQPARQALLPTLVPPKLLVNAVALNMGSMQAVRILSATVAGFLIAFWAYAFGFGEADARAFGGVYLIGAISYVVAVTCTYLLKVPTEGRVARTRDSWSTSMAEGFRFAWSRPVILGILALFGVLSLFGMPYNQVFVPWLALEVMDVGPAGMGLLMAASGIGALAGSLALATVGARLRHRGLLILGALVVMGLALAGLGLTSVLPTTAVFGLMVAFLPSLMVIIVGFGQAAVTTLKNTVLLEVTPNELRGRVFSIQSLDRAFSTMGSAFGGFTIALIGGPMAVAIFGVLLTAGTIGVGAKFVGLRKLD
ncbi:MAG: MFS transporter [Chloroflexi bacterium]|nr:MFS transporter [Chloroflexota bacterium]